MMLTRESFVRPACELNQMSTLLVPKGPSLLLQDQLISS